MPSETSHSANESIEELLEEFSGGSSRKRRGLIKTIEAKAEGLAKLGSSALASFDPEGDDWSAGWILQVLYRHQPKALESLYPTEASGWFNTPSLLGVDYDRLQADLISERFEEADRFTSSTLRRLAGDSAEARGYVYFSEVESMSGIDLCTIDRLWTAYSQGKFGFSAQARLLRSFGERYELLWPRIGWKKEGVWTRYPTAFNWSLTAPDGHMPLINQLRGVRLMDAILNHSALVSRRQEKSL